jgi:CheY-like chemotaxis protein
MAKRGSIVIVDDDIDFLMQFNEMLHLSGYETKIFNNGEAAIPYVRQGKPNLILLDLNMLGKSGWEVSAELKRDPQTACIPIIIVTGECTQEQAKRLREDYGVRKCILKPFKPLEMISEIENVFARKE